jgi:segregation and condensation protein A
MSDQNYNTYTIKLPQFEGPFDLLLFFIERDELDINNIPIAKITDDFLEYIRHIESLNIDLASEFIVVAATLMRIKAKMLLPRKAVDEEGNEIDPREELVQKLLEYKRYKETLDTFRRWEEERANMFGRGIAKDELKKIAELAMVDAELESITLFKLLKAFENVMDQLKDRKVVAHTIAPLCIFDPGTAALSF